MFLNLKNQVMIKITALHVSQTKNERFLGRVGVSSLTHPLSPPKKLYIKSTRLHKKMTTLLPGQTNITIDAYKSLLHDFFDHHQ